MPTNKIIKKKSFNSTRLVVRLFFSLFFVVFVINYSSGSDKYQITNDTSHVHLEKPIQKVSLLFGVNFTHYIPTEYRKDLGDVTAPFCIGGEVLLSYQIIQNWKTYIGANYQYGKITSSHHYYGRRTWFHEVTLPIITDLPSLKLFKTKFLLRTGLYLGTYVKIKHQSRGNKLIPEGDDEWQDVPIDYKDDRFICDYYFGIQNQDLNNLAPLSFILFIKQQLNTNYLKHDITKFKFGLQVKFKL